MSCVVPIFCACHFFRSTMQNAHGPFPTPPQPRILRRLAGCSATRSWFASSQTGTVDLSGSEWAHDSHYRHPCEWQHLPGCCLERSGPELFCWYARAVVSHDGRCSSGSARRGIPRGRVRSTVPDCTHFGQRRRVVGCGGHSRWKEREYHPQLGRAGGGSRDPGQLLSCTAHQFGVVTHTAGSVVRTRSRSGAGGAISQRRGRAMAALPRRAASWTMQRSRIRVSG